LDWQGRAWPPLNGAEMMPTACFFKNTLGVIFCVEEGTKQRRNNVSDVFLTFLRPPRRNQCVKICASIYLSPLQSIATACGQNDSNRINKIMRQSIFLCYLNCCRKASENC
jgi:hypothetical protein